jgi:hypothetical protein
MFFEHYIRLISLVQKGRYYSVEFRQGEQPQGEFKQGEKPQEENGPLPLMSKGEELITLM